jgi:hypothetical protein
MGGRCSAMRLHNKQVGFIYALSAGKERRDELISNMSGRRMANRVGPYSRIGPLAKVDGRSREGRFLKSVRVELTEHVGGFPSATQRALIERAAWLSLRVAQLDAKMARTEGFTDHDSRTYLAWTNSLTRCLRELGLKPVSAPARTLADIVSGKAA